MQRTRQVREVMSHPVITCAPDDPAEQAAWTLTCNAIGAAPVLDGGGFVVGIIAAGDLVRWGELGGSTVDAVMTRPVMTVHATATVNEAVMRMAVSGAGRVPVLDGASVFWSAS